MTLLLGVSIAALALALLALVMTFINLRVYERMDGDRSDGRGEPAGTLVSVCIPARNEESNLEACVRGALASTHGAVEVVVYDDQSTDRTPEIVSRLTAEDARVRVAPSVLLPAGWNGKQHACWRMSQTARGEWLLFTDADVRLEPGAIGAALEAARRYGADLVSTFPRQITGTAAETALVPMIFFILFSYLPMPRMRAGREAGKRDPNATAGCGQFLLVSRRAYDASGGHRAFKDSMHDGIKMPRAVRRAGYHTDLFDGTRVCAVRMYRGLGQTWRGFAKNAYEGLGSMALLIFLTVVHAVGQVWPWIGLGLAAWSVIDGEAGWARAWGVDWRVGAVCGGAIGAALVQRAVLAARFSQRWDTVLWHPIGVIGMTAIQWHSWWLALRGKRAWRGRVQGGGEGTAAGVPAKKG